MNRYDNMNIFARVLRGELPSDKVYENDLVLAFRNIYPQKKVHVLIVPKNQYVSLSDFVENASTEEQTAILKATVKVAKDLGVYETGYRVITNIGADGGQEIFHFHFHLLGGEPVGKLVG